MKLVFVMEKIFLIFLFSSILLSGCLYTFDPRDLQNFPQNSNVKNSNASSVPSSASVVLSVEEVAKHNTLNDCWMIIDSKVYDLSSYTGHPGGTALYVPFCGKDASVAFHTKDNRGIDHSQSAIALLSNFELGSLNQTISALPNNSASNAVQNTVLPSRFGREQEDD